MQIRPESDGERDVVQRVVFAAFEAAAPGQGRRVAELEADLRSGWCGLDGFSLVATDDDVVGQVLLTRAWLDAPRELVPVWVLSPLSVLPDAQRQGIGSALVRAALDRAGRGERPLVFLEGDPGFYPRLRFERASTLGFRPPSDRIPDPAFQVARLPAYQPWMTGLLVYPDVFWKHDAVGLR